MRLGKQSRSRRGLSTVVTSALLVAAAGIMGTVVVAMANSNFAITRENVANSTDSKINLIRESFIVEDVWFYNQLGTDYANVTVRNTGDVVIKVSKIYMNPVNYTEVWNAGQNINATKAATIRVTFDWNPDTTYWVGVKTQRGSEVQQNWKS